MRPTIPAEVLGLGHARAAARRAHDFHEADRLKAAIEAAGYKVVDRGRDFTLLPAHPVDVIEPDGTVRYGWSGAVPSRLEEAPTAPISLVLIVDGDPHAARRTLGGLREHAPTGTHVVLVTAPGAELDAALTDDDLLAPIAGAAPEVIRTALPFRPAAARNAGMRRAAGHVVAWLATGAWINGDIVTPLVAAFDDPTVAVAGAVALRGTDLRYLEPGPAGDADAIDRTLLAFRREELGVLGMLDEHFHTDERLDRWWSLVLRDGPDEPWPDDPEEAAALPPWVPRRGVALDLPIDGSTAVEPWTEPVDGAESARRRKRDLYRVIDRFTGRGELLSPRTADS
jgi:hypothetical protein